MKTHVLDHTKSHKPCRPHGFKRLWKGITEHSRRPREEAVAPVHAGERKLVELTYEEFSSVFFFEAAVLLGKAEVPESSETATKVYAEAPWDMIIGAAKKEGFQDLARHLEAMFCSWLSLSDENAGRRSFRSIVDRTVNSEAA